VKYKIQKCAKQLKKLQLDALLVSNPENIAYLTEYRNINGQLLATCDQQLILFISPLYKDYTQETPYLKIIVLGNGENLATALVQTLKKYKYKRVGFEQSNISYQQQLNLNSKLVENNIIFLKTYNLVKRIRMIKSKKEIDLIRQSVQISKEAFSFIKNIVKPNMTEKTLSIEIERFLRLRGDNEIAFSTIVASEKNSALPHHFPKKEKLGKSFFLIDLGSRYYGYCADLTKIFFWSKIPLHLRNIYDVILEAQEASIKKIREGVTAEEIDTAARIVIEKKGWGKNFSHSLGHGVGLSVHELPLLAPGNKEILKEGMVVTIEPAVYFSNKFGIRIEDMVLVKKNKGEILSGNLNRQPESI